MSIFGQQVAMVVGTGCISLMSDIKVLQGLDGMVGTGCMVESI